MESLSEEKWVSLARIAIALSKNKEFRKREFLVDASNEVFFNKKISGPYFDWVIKVLEEKKFIKVGRDSNNKMISLVNPRGLKKFVEDSFPPSVQIYFFWMNNTKSVYWI